MFLEEKIDRCLALLEQIAGTAKPTGPAPKESKPPKKSEAPTPAPAPATPAVVDFAAAATPAPAEKKEEQVTAEALGVQLVALSKSAKDDTAGYALVAALFSKFKKADGGPVTKRSELQPTDYNAAFKLAKEGCAK